jgi:hypothetical protein
MKALIAGVLILAADPVAAQIPRGANPDQLSIRPIAALSVERFAAVSTFDAVFGQSWGTFMGGALQVARGRLFAQVAVSRFGSTGQRAFVAEEDGYALDAPLTVTITPFEITAGYRIPRAFRQFPSLTPYVGAGIGSYAYKEYSPSADPGENVSMRHAGFLMVGGVELRVHRWVSVAFDLQRTHVPGILGDGGLSRVAGESDLGGVMAQFKVVVGR